MSTPSHNENYLGDQDEERQSNHPMAQYNTDVQNQMPLDALLQTDISNSAMHNKMIETLLHDLKNPLSIIFGSASLLQQQADLPESHKAEAVKSILDSVQDMRKLISDWLNLSKIEGGVRGLNYEKLPVFAFVENCMDSFSDLATSKNLELSFTAPATDVTIEFDHDRMVQATNNLISNAIKYTPDGGQITVRGSSEDDYVIISVSDTGMGISEDALPHIFDRFYRAKRSKSHAISGTGLGLAICKAIIERHHGQITVESTVGIGTTFTYKLPYQQSER